MKIDLHSHSFYSDGLLFTSEVVKLSSQARCDLFSLIDHDTSGGIAEGYIKSRINMALDFKHLYN